jgi:hypothetical protein
MYASQKRLFDVANGLVRGVCHTGVARDGVLHQCFLIQAKMARKLLRAGAGEAQSRARRDQVRSKGRVGSTTQRGSQRDNAASQFCSAPHNEPE